MKKILSVLLVLSICVGMLAGVSFAATIVDEGICGENLTWTLDSAGVLTISGTGAMTDYEKGADVPWFSEDSTVKTAVIEDGVTTIGNYAFSFCDVLESITIGEGVTTIGEYAFYLDSALTSVSIPDSVTTIGALAFQFCDALESLTFGTGVTTIGESAFWGCTSLKHVTIGSGVTTIWWSAFYRCAALESVTLPKSVKTIKASAFGDCSALENVYYEGSETEKSGIDFSTYNESLTNATWHYNYGSEQNVTLSTVNGAQVRTKGTPGLRFISTIDKASVDAGEVVEYGTVLIPSADITDASELVIGATLNGHDVLKVPAKNLYEVTDDTITFTAVITDIKEKNYIRAYTARAYAILKSGSVVYSDVAPSRDVYGISGKVLANPAEELSDAERAFLTRVVRYVDGIEIKINFSKPVEDAQVPLELEVEGFETTISWTTTGGYAHTGKFESGTDYTVTITLTAEEVLSPNDRVLINGEQISYTMSADGKTLTVKKTYEFKDEGYTGIY